MNAPIKRPTNLARAAWMRFRCYAALATARRDTRARLEKGDYRRVLVVCYGNIYRSALVAAYFAQRPIRDVEVRSAGFHPVGGRPAPARHVQLSLLHGIDLAAHRSTVLTDELLRWADLIVLMDRHNWHGLVSRGAAEDRMVWLGALDGGPVEIPDPYRLDDGGVQLVVERLANCTATLATRLDDAGRRQERVTSAGQ
jgi:protein-tyrosine phosphatase